MRSRRAPRALYVLGVLLVVYLGYPVGAFVVRVAGGQQEGWHTAGLRGALWVSVQGATIATLIGVVGGIPLAYVLARRRGWRWEAIGVLVQLPLAVPPLISGILLVYIVGPYTWLGQLSGERLTQTMYGLVIAQSFVSIPFLVVIARSAFRAVDPALGDVAATLGHRPLARFLRVDVPTAADGLRSGVVLMWLRAFGEYGTTVVLAYHPYSLPVYVDNLFSSAPLSQAQAPTILAFGVAVIAITASRLPRPPRIRWRRTVTPAAPVTAAATSIGFDLDATVGTFGLRVTHPAHGHRLAIVGPSGSGKTITLRALAGLLGPDTGTVSFAGADMTRTATETRRIGYVPQGYALIPGRTVYQQATFGIHADPARAAWWINTLGLTDLQDRLPQQLSGGQQQRVSLARALATDPRLVLLDEPFSALDTPVRSQLRRELRRLQQQIGLSTVLVTHDPDDAAMLADEIIVISNGRVLQAGPCRDVYRRPVSTQVGRLLGIDNLFQDKTGPNHTLWQVAPEAVRLLPMANTPATSNDATTSLGRGRITDIIDLGRTIEVLIKLTDGHELRARMLDLPSIEPGDTCDVQADPDAISVWSAPAAQ